MGYNELESLYYDSVNNLDFMVVFTDRNISIEVPIISKNEIKNTQFEFNDLVKSKLYLTTNKSLAIRAEKQYPTVNIQTVSENKITINLSKMRFFMT